MYAQSVRVTLNPEHRFTALQLARAIQGFTSFSSTECLGIARYMLEGKAWEPPPPVLKLSDEEAVNPTFYWGWFDFQITMPPNPYQDQAEKWKAQRAILEAGAAGDAAAAIRYCQMELNHEINHGAMG